MNIDFRGTINRLSPPGVPAYDPSRWRVVEVDDGAMIMEDLPKASEDSVTTRRVAIFKASPYMGIEECRHIAERTVEACKGKQADLLKCDYD